MVRLQIFMNLLKVQSGWTDSFKVMKILEFRVLGGKQHVFNGHMCKLLEEKEYLFQLHQGFGCLLLCLSALSSMNP